MSLRAGYYGLKKMFKDKVINLPAIKSIGSGLTLSSAGELSATGGGGASALSNLSDVDIASALNGQILIYDETLEKWENGDNLSVAVDNVSPGYAGAIGSQRIVIDNIATPIQSTRYMEDTVTLSASQDTAVTFLNDAITGDVFLDVATSVPGLDYKSISASTGTCTVTFEQQSSEISNVKVRVYLR